MESIKAKLSNHDFTIYQPLFNINNQLVTTDDELNNPVTFANNILKYQVYTIRSQSKRLTIPRRLPKTLVEFAMLKNDLQWLSEVFIQLGLNNLNADISVFYDLLWYISMSKMFSILSKEEISYVSGLSVNKLEELVGIRYQGPRDHASLLFAITTGLSSPRLQNTRLREVKQYTPSSVWFIAAYHRIINPRRKYVSPYGPYLFISSFDKTPIEVILSALNLETLNTIIDRYQVASPNNPQYNDPNNLLMFVANEISGYDDVLNRKHNLIPSYNSNYNIFTNQEILDLYHPDFEWTGRRQLIDKLVDYNSKGYISEWSFNTRWCTNIPDEGVIFSYGLAPNYKCYSDVQLIKSFGYDKYGFFKFTIPNEDDTFSIDSIRSLAVMSERQNKYNLENLTNLINHQTNIYFEDQEQLSQLALEYDGFEQQDKFLIQVYFTFALFICLYLRGWEGYGNNYPNLYTSNTPDDIEDRLIIQRKVLEKIKESIKENSKIDKFLGKLPLVYYNNDNKEVFISKDKNINGLSHLLYLLINEKVPIDYTDVMFNCLYYYILLEGSSYYFNTTFDVITKMLIRDEKEVLAEMINEGVVTNKLLDLYQRLDSDIRTKPFDIEQLI